jgi:hypothetical protein
MTLAVKQHRKGRPTADLGLMPRSEIAAKLDISEATVKRDLNSAIRKARAEFAKLAAEGRIDFQVLEGEPKRRCTCKVHEKQREADWRLDGLISGNPEMVAHVDAWKFKASGAFMTNEELDRLPTILHLFPPDERTSVGKTRKAKENLNGD